VSGLGYIDVGMAIRPHRTGNTAIRRLRLMPGTALLLGAALWLSVGMHAVHPLLHCGDAVACEHECHGHDHEEQDDAQRRIEAARSVDAGETPEAASCVVCQFLAKTGAWLSGATNAETFAIPGARRAEPFAARAGAASRIHANGPRAPPSSCSLPA